MDGQLSFDDFARRNGPPSGVPADVAALFEKLALEVAERGWKRYSADAVLHRLRWHEHIEKGNRDFLVNDHWSSVLSRWFLDRHPELKAAKFFELRQTRSEAA